MSTNRRPSLPPMPDLSHLTEDERRIIEDVLKRQRDEEEREQQMIQQMQDEFDSYQQAVKKLSEETKQVTLKMKELSVRFVTRQNLQMEWDTAAITVISSHVHDVAEG